MNRNLFNKELKRGRKNLFIWGAIVIGFTVMILAIFPAMNQMGDSIATLMETLPKELSKALGVDAETWKNILGFYSTYFGIYIILLTGIYAASTGATILSKEERLRTAEFLMTRPVTRQQVFWTKMLALLTLTLIILIAQSAAAILGLVFFGSGKVAWTSFAIMQVHGASLIMFYTGLGVLLSMFLSPLTNYTGLMVGLIFGAYFVDALSKAASEIEWLGYISPFHYADLSGASPDLELNLANVIGLIVLGLACVWFASRLFNKKDIAA